MKIVLMYLLAMAFLISSCTNNASNDNVNGESGVNIYNDATLCNIYELRCSGKSAELMNYFKEQSPEYRKAAVMALGTMKDSNAVLGIASLLSDKDIDVRSAAVFAMGQIGYSLAQKYLMDINFNSQPDEVKSEIMLALGKCGNAQALQFVESVKVPHNNVVLVSGQAKALCWFACRGMFSVNSSQAAIGFVCDTTIHERARAVAAEYFGICDSDFSLYTDEFVKAYRSANLIYNKENIVLALGKCHNERAFSLLKNILADGTTDYRITLNAIVALENYPYYDCKESILNLLESPDEKISTCAARFFFRHGIRPDSALYLDLSRNHPGWQTRTLLLAAALKFSEQKAQISNSIKSGFDVAQNIYEKVALLKALEPDFASFRFVENYTFYSENEMIRTEGLRTLIAMYEDPAFPQYAEAHLAATGEKLRDEFAIIFKTAIQNGNSQMVALAAKAISQHQEISDYYINTFFLNQALNNCRLPQEADTYMTLIEAVKSVNGQLPELPAVDLSMVPDWQFIRSIRPDQEIVLKTTKGEITMRLEVNNAPVAVSSFLKLIDEQYFNNSRFTNINILKVENFGSLSGFDENKAIMIPSELTPMDFDEGTVALLSTALNNSCITQWYVMLTPAALLDGSSSVIATVVSGMDVVHSINTGDEIISVKRK